MLNKLYYESIQEQLPGYNCTFELLCLYSVYILHDSVVYRYLNDIILSYC